MRAPCAAAVRATATTSRASSSSAPSTCRNAPRRSGRNVGARARERVGKIGCEFVKPAGVYVCEFKHSREVLRRPFRTLLSSLGIAGAVALLILGRFGWDSISHYFDTIFLRHVYHHLTQPQEFDRNLVRSLKPGAYLAIIDFPPSSNLPPVEGVPKNRGGHGIPEKVVEEELTTAGLQVDKVIDDWSAHDYCVIFVKRGP